MGASRAAWWRKLICRLILSRRKIKRGSLAPILRWRDAVTGAVSSMWRRVKIACRLLRVRVKVKRGLLQRIRSLKDEALFDSGDVLKDELQHVRRRRAILRGRRRPMPEVRSLIRADGASFAKLADYNKASHALDPPLSALCLSGGGIRSAAFALGVVQGLAARGILYKFDYLSTVSGGGYLGSFLTAWVQRLGYQRVTDDLRGNFAPNELSPLQYLRRYTSYMTPKKGPFTSDTLTIIAHYTRNLLLNWMIIIPLVLCAIIAIKALASMIFSLPATSEWVAGFGLAAIVLLGLATMESLRQRPGWESDSFGSFKFQYYIKWPLLLGCVAASCAALKLFGLPAATSPTRGKMAELIGITSGAAAMVVEIAVIFSSIMFISWMIAFFIAKAPSSTQLSTRDNVRSTWLLATWSLATLVVSGMAVGAALGGMLHVIGSLHDAQIRAFALLCFGPPAVITACFLGETLYVGATSNIRWSDGEREWLATAAGYHARISIGWTLAVLVVFVGPFIVIDSYRHNMITPVDFNWLTTVGGVSGVIVAFLGKASSTAAVMRERYNTWINLGASVILAIAAPVFVAISVSLLAAGVDLFVAGNAMLFPFQGDLLKSESPQSVYAIGESFSQFHRRALPWLGLSFAVCLAIGVLAAYAVNTNRFSLHGLYRNRLIRAFLGASRTSDDSRRPNPLTGFDERDNIDVCDLWPNRCPTNRIPPSFLVVNCSLNILASQELAWQERKAVSFSVTPRSTGAGVLNQRKGYFRRADEYGNAISLGSAMTISGAAVSPNMGYHSSPTLSLLLTFFNVRLGAWFGNPGPSGRGTYRKSGPGFSGAPLYQEAFGLTTEEHRYVYLSDGGHFENLGLYEMIRRRCGLIIISDAGCDPGMTFEDLGNAVRKISIDLNVKINFSSLNIGPRTAPTGVALAAGTITYPEAGAPQGKLLYIKPAYQGDKPDHRSDEPASVRSYAAANPTFPHEPTSDQLFGESQFEAYRALGEYIVQTAIGAEGRSYDKIEEFIDDVARHLKRSAKIGVTQP